MLANLRVSARNGCAVACLLGSTTLFAQTPSADAPVTEPAAAALEEIFVTARKYEESIQDTPIAVTAMTGDDLREKGIVSIEELAKSVPSLEINFHQFYIRGVGERTGFVRVDPTVGMYLDDLFIPRSDGMILDTIDIRALQVLRGPQGTLFGKNTTGGAIVMSLEKPQTEYVTGYVEADIGNYQQKSLRFGVNLPLADQFAARVAFNARYRDSYYDELDGEDTASINRQSIAIQTRWEPSDVFAIDTLVFHGRTRERYAGENCRVSNENALFLNGLYVAWPGDTDPGNLHAYRDNCEDNSVEKLGYLKTRMGPELLDKSIDASMLGITFQWEVADEHTVKLVLGGRLSNKGPMINSDQDGGHGDFQEASNPKGTDSKYGSIELQMNGGFFDSRLRYSSGLFYLQEHNYEPFLLLTGIAGVDAPTGAQILGGQAPTKPSPGGTSPLVGVLNTNINLSNFDLHTKTLAAYLQTSFDVTEQIEWTVGVRWTEETRESDLEVYQSDSDAINARIAEHPCFLPPNSGPITGHTTDAFLAYNTLNPSVCPWSADPVGIAAAMFPDADGDGITDFPMLADPSITDYRKGIFTKVTPMMSLSYTLPEVWLEDGWLSSTMFYATYSEGFKSGFFEPRVLDGLQLVEPEEVVNLEVGFKIEAFDRSLRLNGALYSMDFTNMQLIQVDTDSAGNLAVIFDNAGESSIEGVEVELLWMPLPGTVINLAASSNTYEFQEFTDRDLLSAVLGREEIVDRSDEPFPVSPEKMVSLGAQLSIPTDFGIITPRVDVSYKSDIYMGLDNGSFDSWQQDRNLAGQPAYTLVDARLAWSNSDGSMTLTAFVKNATDKKYRIGAASVGDSIGTFFETYAEPRTFGLQWRQIF